MKYAKRISLTEWSWGKGVRLKIVMRSNTAILVSFWMGGAAKGEPLRSAQELKILKAIAAASNSPWPTQLTKRK